MSIALYIYHVLIGVPVLLPTPLSISTYREIIAREKNIQGEYIGSPQFYALISVIAFFHPPKEKGRQKH